MKEPKKTIYVKKALAINVPESINNHHAKNPFFRLDASIHHYSARSKSNDSWRFPTAAQHSAHVKIYGAGYKQELKNKTWEITQVPKHIVEDTMTFTITIDQVEDSKISAASSLAFGKCTPVLEKVIESKTTFDEDYISLKASLEYKKRMNDNIISSCFNIIKDLTLPTDLEVCSKSIDLTRTMPKSSPKTLFLNLSGTMVATEKRIPQDATDFSAWRKIIYLSMPSNSYKAKFVRLRPGAISLLKELSSIYEICIFGYEEPNFVHEVLKNTLDPFQKYVDRYLSKENCIRLGKHLIKDLRIFSNRDLKNMVIVDKSIVPFCAQLNNGISVPVYRGNESDNALFQIVPFLKDLANSDDVRKIIRQTFYISDLYSIYVKEKSGDPAFLKKKSNITVHSKFSDETLGNKQSEVDLSRKKSTDECSKRIS